MSVDPQEWAATARRDGRAGRRHCTHRAHRREAKPGSTTSTKACRPLRIDARSSPPADDARRRGRRDPVTDRDARLLARTCLATVKGRRYVAHQVTWRRTVDYGLKHPEPAESPRSRQPARCRAMRKVVTLNELRYIVGSRRNELRAPPKCFVVAAALSARSRSSRTSSARRSSSRQERVTYAVGERIVEQAQRVLESSRIRRSRSPSHQLSDAALRRDLHGRPTCSDLIPRCRLRRRCLDIEET